jgi:hypothetical protein
MMLRDATLSILIAVAVVLMVHVVVWAAALRVVMP